MLKDSIKKYRTMPKQVKASFWFLFCNVLLKGISFISTPLFAKLLTENEYGKLSIYMSYQLIIISLATWEIQNGAYLKGLYQYKKDIKFFSAAVQMFMWFITLIIFFILFVFRGFVLEFTGYTKGCILILFVYLISLPGMSFWMTRKRNQYEYRAVVAVSLFSGILVVLFPLIGIWKIGATAEVKFICGLFAESLINIVFIGRNYSADIFKKWTKTKEIWKYLIRFQAPLIPHALSYFILNQADRIMIGKMIGDEKTAIYSVAYNLTMSICIIQAALHQTMTPWIYQKIEEGNYFRISKISEKILLMLEGIILYFALLAPDFIQLLFPDSYHQSIWCIPPIAISVFFIELYTMYTCVISYYENTKYITYGSLICGVMNIVLNYIGIHVWGYIACAYTTLICYILLSFFCYIFAKKVCNENGVSISDIYNNIDIIKLSGAMLAIMSVIVFVIDQSTMRYLTLFIFIIFGIMKRKDFILPNEDISSIYRRK